MNCDKVKRVVKRRTNGMRPGWIHRPEYVAEIRAFAASDGGQFVEAVARKFRRPVPWTYIFMKRHGIKYRRRHKVWFDIGTFKGHENMTVDQIAARTGYKPTTVISLLAKYGRAGKYIHDRAIT